MKICNKCGKEKEISLFAKGKAYKDGYRNICKRCHTDYVIDYYSKNPDKKAEKNKMNSGKYTNWKRHRITKQEFDTMSAKHDGKCHACKINLATSIDHDHSCCPGERSCGLCIRGFLCHHCNTALGLVKDSKETLKNLIEYLK